MSLRRRKTVLSPEELLNIFFEFIVHRAQTREQIRNELRAIRSEFSIINISFVETYTILTRSYILRYGIEFWNDLFGTSFEEYIRSRSFLFDSSRRK